ncbi:zinc ribbon domain-containing protein [Phytoactinopolyspora halotolerans]|uniref:zinc ribbon domain-containing protein n=1 Tax=Phytoactinopolyspora halotolerans TaxID=1981512 RepID=UPI001C205188|nr:C4-type zinc ribbon domain-containing protein [Phytoactinopolyspora halotolerans]
MQKLDLKLDQLAHRRATLPEVAEVQSIAAEHTRLGDALVVAQTTVGDLEREQKRADADVEQVRTRKARDQKRLDSGQVSSPKELESLQREVESLNRRQSELEDAELEIMERLEQAQGEVDALTAQRQTTEQRVREVQQNRDAKWAEIDQEAEEARAQRAELAGQLPDELLALYEKIRASSGGIGAAALRRRMCEGCQMQLDPAEVKRIASFAPEVVIRHDECRRILVRVPDSGL